MATKKSIKNNIEDRQEIDLKKLKRYNRWYWLIKTWDVCALCLSWLLLIPLIAKLEERATERQNKGGNNDN